MTFQSIADQLDLPLGTVLTRMRRALSRLRETTRRKIIDGFSIALASTSMTRSDRRYAPIELDHHIRPTRVTHLSGSNHERNQSLPTRRLFRRVNGVRRICSTALTDKQITEFESLPGMSPSWASALEQEARIFLLGITPNANSATSQVSELMIADQRRLDRICLAASAPSAIDFVGHGRTGSLWF